ncbi:hypothetical protein ACRQ5Q_22365 [Bradyrhizobium sp. PMVTL-01]|uniref:hypothetical protein n=1 Tax=Bradyrhizobium sp. PMVTL-01 TaxID=3434999 RepID=UPI003F702DA8
MCKHMNFAAQVNVARMEDTGQFMADITVRCSECNVPFQFLGMEAGIDTHGARVSVDGLEARIAICPQGARPNPLQRMAFNVKRFDG